LTKKFKSNRLKKVKEIFGIPVSPGIALGKAYLYSGDKLNEIPRYSIKKSQIESEWQRFLQSVKSVNGRLNHLLESLGSGVPTKSEEAKIIKSHLLMTEDPDLFEQVRSQLEKNLENIEWIVRSVSHEMTQKLMSASDSYLRERAQDISDVLHQILSKLLSVRENSLQTISEEVIIAAHDLLPSELLSLNRKFVKAIALDSGSRTTHTSILARSFNIPMVAGLSNFTKEVNSGDTIFVDGIAGKVILSPEETELETGKSLIRTQEALNKEKLSTSSLPAKTKDGKKIVLAANIELPQEADRIFQFGAEGIGLFRSEFLFLSSSGATDEEKQYKIYSEVAKSSGDFPVKIRTFDIGGDKIPASFMRKSENNPLLGWRAIRFCLGMPELFKAQLKAILRAAAAGKNAEILFPLVSGIEELEDALALLEEAKNECKKNGVPIAENIKKGIMIEVPSAVLTADILAKKVDFFSIGTNDLMQYAFAVDRSNEKVNRLSSPAHPAMLRLIKMTIDAAHKNGIPAAMCGEMAGDPHFARLLTGLGLDEFSMNASSIPEVKRIIRDSNFEDCQKLAEEALKCSRTAEVDALLEIKNQGLC